MIDRGPTANTVVTKWKPAPPAKNKKFEIHLMWGDVRQAYHILQITNTTWYRPGIWVSEEIVDKICELENWEVILVSDQMWSNILGFLGGKIPGITL